MCGYSDVVEDEGGRFRCVRCKRVMDQDWLELLDIFAFAKQVKPPPRRYAAINEMR